MRPREFATQTAPGTRQNAKDGSGVLSDGVKQQNGLAVPTGRISTREVAEIIGGDNPQELALKNGAPAQAHKLLDSGKRRLRINDLDLGAYLSESSWAFLDLLAESRPRHFGRATAGDGVLPYAYVVIGIQVNRIDELHQGEAPRKRRDCSTDALKSATEVLSSMARYEDHVRTAQQDLWCQSRNFEWTALQSAQCQVQGINHGVSLRENGIRPEWILHSYRTTSRLLHHLTKRGLQTRGMAMRSTIRPVSGTELAVALVLAITYACPGEASSAHNAGLRA